MSRLTRTLGASLIGASLLAIPAGAFAQTATTGAGTTTTTPAKKAGAHAFRRPFAYGAFVSETTTSLTLNQPLKGSVTVTLSPKARFRNVALKGQKALASQLTTSDQVAVYGNGKKGIARIVRFDSNAFPISRALRFAGTATQGAQGLTVTLKNGKSITVVISATTKIHVAKQVVSVLPQLAAGQKVRVAGRLYTNGTVVARTIVVRAAK